MASPIIDEVFLRLRTIGLISTLALGLLAASMPAEPQDAAKKVPRIGLLRATTLSDAAPNNNAFRQGLRELGYLEGKNILIEHRLAKGKLQRDLLFLLTYPDTGPDDLYEGEGCMV